MHCLSLGASVTARCSRTETRDHPQYDCWPVILFLKLALSFYFTVLVYISKCSLYKAHTVCLVFGVIFVSVYGHVYVDLQLSRSF